MAPEAMFLRRPGIKYDKIKDWPSKCDTCIYRTHSALHCIMFKYDRPHQAWCYLDQPTDQIVQSPMMSVVFKSLPDDESSYVVRCEYYEIDRTKYYDYLESERWRDKRKYKLREVDYQCERCGSAKNLEVHHVNYEHAGEEPMEDLVVLCRDCHREIHRKDLAE